MLSMPPRHKDTILPLFSATTILTEVKFENNIALANSWLKEVGGHDVFIDGGYTVSMTAVDFVNSRVREALLTCQGGRDRDRQVENQAWLNLDKVRFYCPGKEPVHEGELCTITGYPENTVVRETSYQRRIGITGLIDERLPESTYARSEKPRVVDTIVIHHISAIHWNSVDEAFSENFKNAFVAQHPELRTVSAAKRKFHPKFCRALLEAYGVSAHFMIDREGFVTRLVPEDDVAFHAGKSRMPEPDGRTGVNAFSIGIELISAHPNDDPHIASGETPAYTEAQYEALATCIEELRSRYVIKSVVGHDEIAGPRKKDPGPLFDWSRVRDVN